MIPDRMATIQEWLFSDSLPTIDKEQKIYSWITNEEDLESFFRLIVSPFKSFIHMKGRKKYAKLTAELDIKFASNDQGDRPFEYNPNKHNGYYYRAQKMALCMFYRPNLVAIKELCPNFVNAFYKVILEEFINNYKSKADVNHIVRMVQYFYMYEPQLSMANIIATHFFYVLLMNIEVDSCRDTIISLMCQGDPLLKVEEQETNQLYKYLEITRFTELLASNLLYLTPSKILAHIEMIKVNQEVLKFISSLEHRSSSHILQFRNINLNWFHSFFNVNLLTRLSKQPEEIYSNILDIDRLKEAIVEEDERLKNISELSESEDSCTESDQHSAQNTPLAKISYRGSIGVMSKEQRDSKRISMRKSFASEVNKFKKMNTVNFDEDQESIINNPEVRDELTHAILAQEGSMLDLEVLEGLIHTEKPMIVPDTPSKSLGMKTPSLNLRSAITSIRVKPLKKTKALREFQRVVLAIITINLMKSLSEEAGYIKTQKRKKLKLVSYPEAILLISDGVRLKMERVSKKTLVINEERSLQLMSTFYHLIRQFHMNQINLEMNQKLRMNIVEDSSLSRLLFSDENNRIIIELFEVYLFKVNFALDNGIDFESGYYAGKTFNFLAKNM